MFARAKVRSVMCGVIWIKRTNWDTCDAAVLPFADESFASVLCDPPYNGKFQWNHDLLKELSRVASQRIIFQHWFIPADPEGQWKKWHKFSLREAYIWQPRTYFGRVQVISVFDASVNFDAPRDSGKKTLTRSDAILGAIHERTRDG